MDLLKGKVALVTGAASGIGQAAAILFAREGALLAIADRDEAGCQATADRILDAGGNVITIGCDVSDQDAVAAMIRKVVDEYGRLDCAFNNAGVVMPSAPFADVPDEDWTRNMAVNLDGVRFCMKHEIVAMRAQGAGGSIVNTASGAGLKGAPLVAAYTASKHAVVGLTRTAAIDHGKDGIRINALCPGFIHTPMTDWIVEGGREIDVNALSPLGRGGQPEDVAEAALWLASDRSAYITGVALPVDGGALA